MSGAHLSPYEYALHKVIVLFGEFLIQLDEAGFSNTYRKVLRYCELENILYQCKDAYARVRRYMDMVAHVDSSDYMCRRVDVKVRLSLEI